MIAGVGRPRPYWRIEGRAWRGVAICSRHLAAIVASALVLLLTGAASATDGGPRQRDNVWAQTYSDIRPDRDVLFGRLPNGMLYAVQHNATPPRQVSIRFRIGAGSIDERDDQQGLAHFLEHMAFKGSTHVAEDDLRKILERLGLAFGADTNASTSWNKTLYQFDLPENDPKTVDTGLMLMRETASELTLGGHAMDRERGVILSEERLRDTPSYREQKAEIGFLLDGQRAPARFPIGKVDIIKEAPVSLVADFYRAHYRPESAALIVVGDIDPATVEARIRALFGSWHAATPPPPPIDRGRVEGRGETIRLDAIPGALPEIMIAWTRPYDDSADTGAIRRRDFVRGIALAVLNRRLEAASRTSTQPFLQARVDRQNLLKSADVTELSIATTAEGWRRALIAAEGIRRQAILYPVTQSEIDREVEEFRTLLRSATSETATRRTPDLARDLVDAVDDDRVATDPAQVLTIFEDAVRGLTPERVAAILRESFTGAGPLVFMAMPKEPAGGSVSLTAAFHEAESTAVGPASAEAMKQWLYGRSAAPPSRVVWRGQVPDLGLTLVRFANGVSVTIKPTRFQANEVIVEARVGRGMLDLSPSVPSPRWAAPAFVAGGLRGLSLQDLERIFADKVLSAHFIVGEDSFRLRGVTTTTDFDAQLQLLEAYVAEPALRADAFDQVRRQTSSRLDEQDTTPEGVFEQNGALLEHGGDARWRWPSQGDLASTRPDALRGMVMPALTGEPIELVIVGDVEVDRAIDAVSRTFGNLPKRRDATPPPAAELNVRFPGGASPVTLAHDGRADQAIALIGWRTDDFIEAPQRARATRVLEQLLRMHLIDRFRIAMGATYSPSTQFEASQVFPHFGFIAAQVETTPDKVRPFYDLVEAIARDMRDRVPTPDELERARQPRLETISNAAQTNEYWVAALGGAAADPRLQDAIRDAVPGLRRVTAEDVRRVADEYLRPDREWRLTILPRRLVR